MSIPGFRSPAAHQTGANRPSASIGAYAQNAGKPRAGGPLALLLGLALLLPACKHTPPEQALRDTIAKMQSAGETGDVDALFKPIAEDFSGSEGMDRTAFKRYVTLMRMSHKDVGVALGPIEVKLLGDRATANFTATITGGPGFLPDQAQIYDIQTGWRLSGSDWQLINARWTPKL